MVLQSTRWLALGYFTYFFSYGIFLPFWSVWLKGIGLTPETIGLLLGAGLVARFLGSLLIAPRVSDPSRLISALRVLALLTLLFAVAFWAGAHVAWLMLVMGVLPDRAKIILGQSTSLFEAQLAEQLRFVEVLLEATPTAIYLKDLQDPTTGKIPPRLVDIKSDKFTSVVENILNAITPADYEAAKQYVPNPEEYDFHKILNWK